MDPDLVDITWYKELWFRNVSNILDTINKYM